MSDEEQINRKESEPTYGQSFMAKLVAFLDARDRLDPIDEAEAAAELEREVDEIAKDVFGALGELGL